MRPFRFLASQDGLADARTVIDRARRAESMGYSSLVLSDHLVEQLSPLPVSSRRSRLQHSAFVLDLSCFLIDDTETFAMAPVVERLAGT